MTPTDSKHVNMICALKYAKYESNQFLLVFMTEGQVLCLDTIREQFVQTQDGNYALIEVQKHPVIDLKKNVCLTVGERGHGIVFEIEIAEFLQLSSHHSLSVNEPNEISLKLSYNF